MHLVGQLALQRVKRKLERYLDNRGEDSDVGGMYKGLSGLNKELQGELAKIRK